MAESLFQNKEYHLFLPNNVKQEYVSGGSFNYDNYPEGRNKASYLGPGTKYKERITEGYEGAWDLDKSAKYHDEFYDKFSDNYLRALSDGALAYKADKIINDEKKYSKDERDQAKLVKTIMKANQGIHFVKSLNSNKKMDYQGNAYVMNNENGFCELIMSDQEFQKLQSTGTLVIKPMHKLTIKLSLQEANRIKRNIMSGKTTMIKVGPEHQMQHKGGFLGILGPILGTLAGPIINGIASLFGKKD